MNTSTALAQELVDTLLRHGVREAVLAPGSRSAPIGYALRRAQAAGLLRLHVRIDERSAGFLALGLAKASHRPVAVVTTSGTAAVNLHPALVEAAYSGLPLVAVTADRPPELRGVGANQAIDQRRLFGPDATYVELGPEPGGLADAVPLLRGARGPVHLNVALREPLVPDGVPAWPSRPPAEPAAAPAAAPVAATDSAAAATTTLPAGPRTVLVAGDGAGPEARRLAEAAGWPLLAEPSSGARAGGHAIGTYRLLLEHLGDEVERVVVLGRPTLSRPVTRLLQRADVALFLRPGDHPLPTLGRTDATVIQHLAGVTGTTADDAWLRRWQDADRAARHAVEDLLGGHVTGPAVARTLARTLDTTDLLVVGSSASIRDLDLAPPWPDAPTVLANRGAAGIDGTVSTAVGAALGHVGGRAFALLGDLTFLHDGNGLVLGPDEPRPDLTILVNNDDGGAIFGQLEQGGPEHAADFERLFGTPHHVDLAALSAATATPYVRVDDLDQLATTLAGPVAGIRVVEVRTDRHRRREQDEQLRDAVAAAVQVLL